MESSFFIICFYSVPGVPVEQLELRQTGVRRGAAGAVGGRGVLVDGASLLQAALRGREGARRRRRHPRLRRHREIPGERDTTMKHSSVTNKFTCPVACIDCPSKSKLQRIQLDATHEFGLFQIQCVVWPGGRIGGADEMMTVSQSPEKDKVGF